jgi:hypothetical protein
VRSHRLKIVFTEKFDLESVERFVETNALGLGTAYRAGDNSVVLVKAAGEKEHKILKEQLDLWMTQGLLTYEEQT